MSQGLVSASIDLDVDGFLSLNVQANTIHVIYSEHDRQRATHFTPQQLLDSLLRSPEVSWATTREGPRR